MKVGTDGVLLGCLVEAGKSKRILDIGTGTGLLALMMAQQSEAIIDAIEIDEIAYEEAKQNFATSKWSERLNAYNCSFKDFLTRTGYDLIISNPPFFNHGKQYSISDEQRSLARHDKELPFEILIDNAIKILTDDGKFWLILPKNEALDFTKIATEKRLYLQKEILIKPKPSRQYNRVVMCFGKQEMKSVQQTIVIYRENSETTEQYYELTKDFLLWNKIHN